MDILPDYPDVEVVWRPCEAHPRLEYASQYSNLATSALFYVRDAGGDTPSFIDKVFEAWFADRKRIDDIELLASIASEVSNIYLKSICDITFFYIPGTLIAARFFCSQEIYLPKIKKY